jgi:uncharacterized membrane protein YeaQ/YmgE (transglycosylase-associated protein family)
MFLTLLIVLIVLFVALPLIGLSAWGLLTALVVGLILGALGRLVVPGGQNLGFWLTVMAGLCGSIVGGYLGDTVLDLGWFATVLIEIAVAAAAVALIGAVARSSSTDAPA